MQKEPETLPEWVRPGDLGTQAELQWDVQAPHWQELLCHNLPHQHSWGHNQCWWNIFHIFYILHEKSILDTDHVDKEDPEGDAVVEMDLLPDHDATFCQATIKEIHEDKDDIEHNGDERKQDLEVDIPGPDSIHLQQSVRRSSRIQTPSLRFLETIANSED